MTEFQKWLNTFIEEKALDLNEQLTIPNSSETLTVNEVLEAIKQAPSKEQKEIKIKLIQIDFRNASVTHFLAHLAQALVTK